MSVDERLAGEAAGSETIEFVLEDKAGASSAEMIRAETDDKMPESASDETADPHAVSAADAADIAEDADDELSPVFRELALPRLPKLRREDRARLQIQSPNRLYFYWSLRANPWQTLNRALGSATSNYTLALRLVDLKRDAEELHAVDAEGNWWFNVDADGRYRAEIGFYAPNRPFVRVLYSNTVQTPRKSPSPRAAAEAEWRIPAKKFAEVLDVSGFRRDAFDVAIAGDDAVAAEDSTYRAFSRLTGRPAAEFSGVDTDELRYAMLALAAGATLEELRFRVSARLFFLLRSVAASASRADALAALRTEFDIEEDELVTESEEFGPAVFGASLVNFPKRSRRLRTRPRGFDRVSRFEPVSSFVRGGSGAGIG